jgi:predicted nucleotidyltransferase
VNETLRSTISRALKNDRRIVFAYLHGSAVTAKTHNDIDIAVFSRPGIAPNILSADLKVALYERTGLPPDVFDVRVINDTVDKGDLLALLFLKNVFSHNVLLVDRSREIRAGFIERYGTKFRECEGLISEVLS